MGDIGSNNKYPYNSLSNFSPHPFTIDGVLCNSMEGFLQSLKFKNPEMQKEVCLLVGKQAKFKGKRKKWYKSQTLYWQGKEYKRDSNEYQELLDKAYTEIYNNESFREALKKTKGILTHSMGKKKTNETVLTEKEFCSRLMKLRESGCL